jgi:hypothetical protein
MSSRQRRGIQLTPIISHGWSLSDPIGLGLKEREPTKHFKSYILARDCHAERRAQRTRFDISRNPNRNRIGNLEISDRNR